MPSARDRKVLPGRHPACGVLTRGSGFGLAANPLRPGALQPRSVLKAAMKRNTPSTTPTVTATAPKR